MDTNEVKDAVSKDVTLQRRALFGLILVALLIGLGLAGGIKGFELKKQAPVAKAASMHHLSSRAAAETDRELAPRETELFGRAYPIAPDPVPLPLLAVAPLGGLPIMKYFKFDHLPEKLQAVSRPLGELAEKMAVDLPDCAEKSAGMRKLLEAKDCFVRAALEEQKVVSPGDPANIPGVSRG